MDILKVLSRGTKRRSKSAAHCGSAPAKLPSAGTKTNPQLFHDAVRGQKRKRNCDEACDETAANLPVVDFFAPKDDAAEKQKPEAPKADRAPSLPAASARKLSDDECRQLLRSHRVKITLMSQLEGQNKVSKSKKKKVALEVDKADKKQLFPQPLDSFGELRSTYGISRRVSENLVAQGYRVPTEVQLGGLPLLLRPEIALSGKAGVEAGVDFLAVAPTGSGKTISFLVPAINGIMRRRAQEKRQGVHELEAVVVAPTRELASQLVNEGHKLVRGAGVKIVGLRKGMKLAAGQQGLVDDSSEDEADQEGQDDDESRSEDEHEATGKPRAETKEDILVTTPLVLFNLLTSGLAGTCGALPTVRDLVLDEADVLLDPLFRDQTMGIWTACSNPELRVSCWSATMGSNIESLVTEKLSSRAQALGIAPRPLVRLVVGLKDTAVPNIVHKLVYTASEQGKLLALRQLLHPTSRDSGPALRPPFLVFTQTIERATALHEELKYDMPFEAGGAARIAALHSGLSESARAAIMRKFRAGEVWVLITTDVLARGVDFVGVNGVVNYDVPGSSAGYVHRAGRTGRAGREGGVAVTLYTREDIPFVKTVANAIAASERQAGRTGDAAGVQQWLLDALPDVAKADRKKLKRRGVEARRSGSSQARITSRSGYERRREHNRRGAIEGSRRKAEEAEEAEAEQDAGDEDGGEWAGLGD